MSNKYGAIYAIAKSPQLGMTDEELHLLVGGMTGKDSLKELTPRELMDLTTKLQEMRDSESGKKDKRNFTRKGNRATEHQRRKMYMLMKDLGWNDKRVRGFARKMVGTETIEWLNHEQCAILIEGMKKLIEAGGNADDKQGQ